MKTKTKFLTLSLLTLTSFLIVPLVHAASSSSITSLPAKVNHSANPGEKIRNTLSLINSSNYTAVLKVSIKNFKTDPSGKINFYDDKSDQSATKWLVPQYDVITVPALNTVKMDYIINIAKDMPGKGYDGVIVFQLYNPTKKTTSGEGFGTLVTVNVLTKGITTGGTISDFSMPIVQFSDPVKFGFKINNPSNSNVSFSGQATITNIFGKVTSQFEVGPLEVYPKSTNLFNFEWNNSPLFGLYKGEVQLSNSMQQKSKIASSAWFLFLPWQKTLLGLAILMIAIIVLILLFKLAGRRTIAKKRDMILERKI
jgi:hypothetical protein